MDDETPSRLRETLLDLLRQQRSPADTDALRRQMLATTLRLAGHTVNQKPSDPAAPAPIAPPDDAGQPEDTAQPNDLSSDDFAQPDGAIEPFEVAPPGGMTQPDRPAEAGSPHLRYDVAWVDDPAQPGADGSLRSLPVSVNEPIIASQPGAATRDPAQYVVPEANPASASAGSHSASAAGGAGLMPTADPPSDDAPPILPLVLDEGSASSLNPPAPGSVPTSLRPGAGAFSDPASFDGGDGDSGGGRGGAIPTGRADGSPAPDDQSPAAADPLSIDVTPIDSDEIRTEVMQEVAALIDATVGQRIDQLRHEAFVSRAAWSAAFPR